MIANKIFYLPGKEELMPVNIKVTFNTDPNHSAMLEFEDGSEMASDIDFMNIFNHYVYSHKESVTWPLETVQERIEYVKRALTSGFKRWNRDYLDK